MLSLIMTVKNEAEVLPAWLDSLGKQTIQPDEIVIVDGGSTDGTWQWLESVASTTLHVYQYPGNIAEGRNAAIREAKGDIVVVTDAGCTYAPSWLEKITASLRAQQADFVTTGFGPWFQPEDTMLVYGIASATIPAPREFSKSWLASSRSSAFYKKVWEHVGGYPEWIPFCEDVIFDLKIKKTGAREQCIAEPLVSWRPRTTVRSFWRQLYNYTRSDGHGKLNYNRQSIRFVSYALLVALLGLAFVDARSLLVLAVLGAAYSFKFWIRWLVFTSQKSVLYRLVGFVLVPMLVGFGDIAKMYGWIIGCIERQRGVVTYKPW